MKHLFCTALFCLLFIASVFPQERVSESQKLNQQMTALYQQGRLDEALPIAEKLVKIQREEKIPSSKNLINSLENLSRIKLTRYKRAMAELASPEIKLGEIKNTTEKMRKDGKEAEAALREALSIAKNNGINSTDQIISIQNDLAWLLYNFFPADGNSPTGFDKQDRDKFDSLNKIKFYKRINEAEEIYQKALKNSESVLGSESDGTFLTIYNYAEFQFAMGDFENAIPKYEKCIALVEKKYGKNSQNLILPMESYLKVLVATNQEDPAMDILSRIVRITGKSSRIPKSLPNITLRADKAFVTEISPAAERKARENSEKAELSGRGAVSVTGGTDEQAYTRIQNSSALGKSYYDNTQGIKVTRIAVRVLIDENGKVLEAEGLTNDKDYKLFAEKTVKGWTFRPFVNEGQSKKLTGYVQCMFLAEQFAK